MAQNWDEEHLLEMILSGEERQINDAAAEISRLSWNMVAKIVRIGGGTNNDVQTIIADAILALFNIVQAGSFDPDRASLKTLFYRIAKNKWLDELDRRSGHSAPLIPLTNEYDNIRDFSPNRIDIQLFTKEEEAAMDRALAQLSPECRELINLIYNRGISLRVVAERLRISESAIKKRHQRCKEKLRNIFGHDPRIG
jgi:RNA polymerase sigma-70 factor (ECF subfamily)